MLKKVTLTMILFCVFSLVLGQYGYTYKLLNEKPERGYFFYSCPEGYKEVGVFHKCVPIEKEDKKVDEQVKNQPKLEDRKSKENKENEVIVQKEDSKEDDKKSDVDNKTVVSVDKKPKNWDGETFEFPVREDIKKIPAIYNFLMHPENEEYAKNFLEWQYKYMQHLKKIGFGVTTAYNKYGVDVYPINGYASSVIESGLEQVNYRRHMKKLIQKIQNRIGLFFFFSQTCPICKEQIPIMDNLVQMYGVKIRGVLAHEPDPDLPLPSRFKYVHNPYLFQKFGVTHVPAIVAVYFNPDTGESDVKFLGSGLTPADIVLEGMVKFAELKGVIKGIEAMPTRSYMINGQVQGN